jgi:hypothetical protein
MGPIATIEPRRWRSQMFFSGNTWGVAPGWYEGRRWRPTEFALIRVDNVLLHPPPANFIRLTNRSRYTCFHKKSLPHETSLWWSPD